ncbi:hypothetical protein MMAG44476_39265 [Mycolicibacterium mageritense DSM 44476 = CIP 104973]|uniref:hypothetical protein n=1 Tax=Mycolicibacterium mageritense TaxID=53462 RepID=UPI003B0011D4
MSTAAETLWPIPDDLRGTGRTAAETIRAFLDKHDLMEHGGGGRFYTPEQWADRGEDYGTKSLLVVTHDGGDHARAFNLDYGNHQSHEALQNALGEVGMYVEGCTTWYSAVYRR